MSISGISSKLPLKTTLYYLLIGATWIILSDTANYFLSGSHEPKEYLIVSISKGLLFIAVTALLLYVILVDFTAKLNTENKKFFYITEHVNDLVYHYRLQPKPHYHYINPAIEEITGIPHQKFYKDVQLMQQIIHPDDLPLFTEFISHQKLPAILRLRHIDGTYRLLEHQYYPEYDEHNNLFGVYGIARDATLRLRMEQALKESEIRLSELNNLKTIILRNLSHEFRTPLFIIIGYCDLLQEEVKKAESVQMLTIIRHNAERILQTFSTIIDISRFEASQQDFPPQVFDLTALCRETAENFRGELKAAVSLTCDLPEPVLIMGCRDAIKKLLLELLKNSEKFTNFGEIILSCKAEGGLRCSQYI